MKWVLDKALEFFLPRMNSDIEIFTNDPFSTELGSLLDDQIVLIEIFFMVSHSNINITIMHTSFLGIWRR